MARIGISLGGAFLLFLLDYIVSPETLGHYHIDKIQHLLMGGCIVLFFSVVLNTAWQFFCAVFIIGIFWEVFEVYVGFGLHIPPTWFLMDSLGDVSANILGAYLLYRLVLPRLQ